MTLIAMHILRICQSKIC